MPTFRYKAFGGRGELTEGDIDAATPEEVTELLWKRGLTAFEMSRRDKAASWWAPRGAKRLAGVQSPLVRDLATLADAGVPIDEALRLVVEHASSRPLQRAAQQLLDRVLRGQVLSEAMKSQPQVFSRECTSVVSAAELAGKVPAALGELADLFDRREEQQAKVRAALVYPAILVCLSILTVVVLVSVLVPSVAPLFADSRRPMPTVLAVGIALQSHSVELWTGLLIALLLAVGLVRLVQRTPRLRLAADSTLTKLPLVGTLLCERDVGRFSYTLGTMLRSGVPLLPALTSARQVIGNTYIRHLVDRAISRVREGSALHEALAGAQPIPKLALRLIAVGEQSGQLNRMLHQIALVLDKKVQRSIETLTSLITPVLTLAVAAIVGGLVLAIMTTVFDLNDMAMR